MTEKKKFICVEILDSDDINLIGKQGKKKRTYVDKYANRTITAFRQMTCRDGGVSFAGRRTEKRGKRAGKDKAGHLLG
ncbi:MAG: hypothetical protein ACOC6M_01175, partial [Halobacteriota archaeon]